MTVDRGAILSALRELCDEEPRFYFAKDVSIRMGLKQSSPLARTVRKELEAMAKEGVVDTRVDNGLGRMFMAKDEPGAEGEPRRRRGGRAPVAVHRLLSVLTEGPRRSGLRALGVDPSTIRKAVVDGYVDNAAEGYTLTEAGRRRLAEIEEDYPEMAQGAPREGQGQQEPEPEESEPEPSPETVPPSDVAGIPEVPPSDAASEPEQDEDPEPEPMPIEDKAEAKAEAKAEVQPLPEPESKSESEPEFEPEYMNPMSKLMEADVDPEPDEPPLSAPLNAVIVSAQAAALLHVRTPGGPMLVCSPIDPRVLGAMASMEDAVGRAVRLRDSGGRVQVGHIVDDVWRDAL